MHARPDYVVTDLTPRERAAFANASSYDPVFHADDTTVVRVTANASPE